MTSRATTPDQAEAEIEQLVNTFIKQWIPDYYAHLVDSDMNDGQRLRTGLTNLTLKFMNKARIEAVEHYLDSCGIQRTEPSRRTLELFQDGQKQRYDEMYPDEVKVI